MDRHFDALCGGRVHHLAPTLAVSAREEHRAHRDRPDTDAILAGHLDRIVLEAQRRPGIRPLTGAVIAERLRSLARSREAETAGRRGASRVPDADLAADGAA